MKAEAATTSNAKRDMKGNGGNVGCKGKTRGNEGDDQEHQQI